MLLSVTLGDTQLGIPRAVFLSGNAFAQLTGKQVIIDRQDKENNLCNTIFFNKYA